ncbi:class I SAM-dependent methyltransferase [Nocardia stercoris]|uniref:Methyltransferase domain-containing protein n=1 Tax=Nocardia stercoris TaxID=2483361 RepID=A0A3M2KQJ8_9NOCA|nr:methyltransferase domain-containing protein [Nocardia stercoris]RMI27922.1 methyltransferase domain-containing protein [Nocardia stercoris]
MKTTTATRGFNDLITGSFDRLAQAYDFPLLQRVVYQPPQDEAIAELRAARSRRVADIGCGTGVLTTRIDRVLAPEQVFGVDPSAGMLAQARARSNRITWLESCAEELPFEDRALDAVVTTTAFHFFDQPAALREFARVLEPGGLVVIATVHFDGPLVRPLQELTRHSLSPAHTPSPAETRMLLDEAGFTVTDQRRISRKLPNWLVPDVITVAHRHR